MMDLNGTPQSKAALVQWLRARHPNLFRQIVREAGVTLGDFSSTLNKIFTTVRDTVATLGPAYIQTKAEIELLKLNIARAKRGEMPLAQLPSGTVPVDQGGAVVATRGGGGGLPSWAIPVGIGAVLLLFLMRR